mgnify:CR=1 FL=1
MAQPTFEQFYSAIAEQESGGNYGAVGVWVGGDRAYGKYQIMGANIPSWTKAYLGYSMTPQQFLKSPSAQEKVAKGKLKSYYNKYGARGAASAWYSGNPNLHMSTNSQPGGPSIKGYVDSVINKAFKYPSSGGPSATSGGGGGKDPVVPKLSRAELAEQYGFTSAFLKANKEIGKLFNQMVSGGWTKEKFQAKLRDTKWWKTQSESERAYLTLKFTDPATAKQKLDQAMVKVNQMMQQMGLSGKEMSKANIKKYAYLLVSKGYDESQLRYVLGSRINATSSNHQGAAGEAWDEAQAYLYTMGIKWSDKKLNEYVEGIARGIRTMQDIKNAAQQEAKASFPQWAKQIDAGQSVMDVAQPYMQSMAQILEVAPATLSLFDPTIKKTLNYVNPSTLKKEAKPLWQFENELRSDSRWKKTKNAQDSLMGVAHQVLADFGVKY